MVTISQGKWNCHIGTIDEIMTILDAEGIEPSQIIYFDLPASSAGANCTIIYKSV